MSNEIIININEANKAQKYQNEEELFQIEAFKRVSEILKEHRVGKDTTDITDCRFHDTIFIDGNRGVGKTAFMINIEHYYKYIAKIDKPNYLFLKPVDPTLLENTEKFLSVVLARIIEYINEKRDEFNSEYSEEYYKSIENLSKSLESIKTLDNDLGIEEIASNKSSLKLEQHAHDFFSVVCSIFEKNAIVMLIDDVDMAFDKGFDVLEVVRKYLASPYLIPIVAGDMKLYREIVETKFMSKIEFSKDVETFKLVKNIFEKGCSDDKQKEKNWDTNVLGCNHDVLIENRNNYLDKKNLLENIVKQYLEKVFPNEYHIKLKDIFSILKEKNVQIKFSDSLTVPYTEVKDFEIRHINLGINQVKFTYQIFSNNTRDLIQYLYSKKNIYIYFFDKLLNSYSSDAKHQKYVPQTVIKKYDKDIMDFIFNQKEFYKKSLEITSRIYEFGDEKQKDLSKFAENDARSYRGGEYQIYNAFLDDLFENTKLSAEEGKNEIIIHYRDFEKVKSFNDKEKYIVDLFVHSNYYSTRNQTKNYIFSGGFVELMFFSLSLNKKLDFLEEYDTEELIDFSIDIIIDDNLVRDFNAAKKYYVLEDVDITEISNILDDIAYKIPFNSMFRKNKNFENSEEITEDELLTSISHNKKFLSELSIDILVWKNTFLDDIKINSISMYEIMHKFFNNLNLLKNQKLVEETPLSFIQRIVFIFINSVAFFENSNRRVAETNIAMKNKFELKSILTNTNAYNQNIRPMLKEKSLTRALFYHPIITAILLPSNELNFQKSDQINYYEKAITTLESYYDYNLRALQIIHKIQLLMNLLRDIDDINLLREISEIDNFRNRFLTDHIRTATKEQLKIFNDLRTKFEDKIK